MGLMNPVSEPFLIQILIEARLCFISICIFWAVAKWPGHPDDLFHMIPIVIPLGNH